MNSFYDSRKPENRNINDFTYKADIGSFVSGLNEDYKIPDDENYTRKGKPKPPVYGPEPGLISEEVYDPESELASFLYMNITGQIETSNIVSNDLVAAKYTLITGTEWDLVEGSLTNESQMAKRLPGCEFIT